MYKSQEPEAKNRDRIQRYLTSEDIDRLRALHHELAPKYYDLAENIEHLGCYLGKGDNASCSLPIDGTNKRIVVKPELRLETRLAESGKPIQRTEDHPEYDSHSVGDDSEKQRIDADFYEIRRDYVQGFFGREMTREHILQLEVKLRTRDVKDHRLYLWEEMHREGNDLFGKINRYGSEAEGVFLTIAAAHWLKEQGPFYCERAEEHYKDLGVNFRWKNDMERAVVLEVQNGETKHYPIVTDQQLINDGLQAQVSLVEDLMGEGMADFLGGASMSYRKVQDEMRKGKMGSTGVFVLPSSVNLSSTG